MIPFKDISIQDKMMVQTYTLTSEINGQNNAGFRVGVIF